MKYLLALSLALTLGCGSEPSGDDEMLYIYGWKPINTTIRAVTPNGITGNFLLGGDENGGVVCAQATSCDIAIERTGKYFIMLEAERHLFIWLRFNLTESDDGKMINMNWDAEGAWGLAPSGWFKDESGELIEVSTYTDFIDGKHGVFINVVGPTATVTGNTFYGEETMHGSTVEGTISDDLKVISYKLVGGNGKVWEGAIFQ